MIKFLHPLQALIYAASRFGCGNDFALILTLPSSARPGTSHNYTGTRMDLYEIGAGITALLMFGAMFLTQMPKEWHSAGGWLLMSLAVIPLFILVICLCLNYPPLLFGALIFMGFSARKGF